MKTRSERKCTACTYWGSAAFPYVWSPDVSSMTSVWSGGCPTWSSSPSWSWYWFPGGPVAPQFHSLLTVFLPLLSSLSLPPDSNLSRRPVWLMGKV